MAVIINELEVIVEPPSPVKSPTSTPRPSEPQQLKPIDLKEIDERNRYIWLRTFAH